MTTAEDYRQNLMMTLAMLGYRRWLPRKSSSAPALRQVQPEVALPTPLSEATDVPDVAGFAVSDDGNAVAAPIHHYNVAEGVCVSRDGVLITAPDCPFAWFAPPPWREGTGYQAWADAGEGQFIDDVLVMLGLQKAADLLRRYADLAINITSLPTAPLQPLSLTLPVHADYIYTFSGRACHALVGQVQAADPVMMDWQGRQVQVICLPHPYRCLVHPATKEQLWRILIRLTYEMQT